MDNELKEILNLILNKVSTLEEGQKVLEEGQKVLEEGQKVLTQDVQRINIKLENIIEPKIQLIYENQVEIIEHNEKFEGYDNRLESLETDVFALKHAFKASKQV